MSTDVTSVGMVSEFPEPSLQGHFSTGFDGAGLRSEFGFAGTCLWAQHGLVIWSVWVMDWEGEAGAPGWEEDASNRPAVQQQSRGPIATARISW